jgi:hypothetical protein
MVGLAGASRDELATCAGRLDIGGMVKITIGAAAFAALAASRQL